MAVAIASSVLLSCTRAQADEDTREADTGSTTGEDESVGDGDSGTESSETGDGDGDPGGTEAGGDGDGDPKGEHLSAAHCPAPPAHAPGTGVFAGGGGVEGRVGSSLDGLDWLDDTTTSNGPQYEGHSRNLIRGFGYGGGVFVAVGGLDNAYLVRSCDGVTWDHDLLGTNIEGDLDPTHANFLSDIAYLDGVFVAAGGAGLILRSDDHSLTWARVGPDWYEGHLRGVAAGGGRFVAVGHAWEGDLGATIVSGDAGLTWTEVQHSAGGLWQVVYAHGRFVAIGAGRCASSVDGEAWTDCGLDTGPGLLDLHHVAGQLLIQRGDGSYLSSPEGESWSMSEAGWLPGALASNAARVVMARDNQRGYGDSPMGPWTSVELPGLTALAWGEVLWAGP